MLLFPSLFTTHFYTKIRKSFSSPPSMSSTTISSRSGRRVPSDLNYENRRCACGKNAHIRVSESSGNSHKLYYVCGTRTCGLWDWCHPTNYRGHLDQANNPNLLQVSNTNESGGSGDMMQLLKMSIFGNCLLGMLCFILVVALIIATWK